jgi:hypothetical protein
MSFFSNPISAPVVDPLAEAGLPTSYKDAVAEDASGNATFTVHAIRAVEGKDPSKYAGLVYEVEIQTDSGFSLEPGRGESAGLSCMQTIRTKEGRGPSRVDAARDGGKVEGRFGPLFAEAGFPLSKNADGIMTPGGMGFADEEIGAALKAIEKQSGRCFVWTYKSKKDESLGVDFLAVKPE